jgi:hypothetical protein
MASLTMDTAWNNLALFKEGPVLVGVRNNIKNAAMLAHGEQ